jgi:dolichol-phosphate mannosyltransferase
MLVMQSPELEPKVVKNTSNGLEPYSAIKLGVVCPMANESATAVEFVNAVLRECNQFGFQSVTFFSVLDNVSTDDTQELMRQLAREQPQLEIVWAPENRCVRDAFVRGYREAIGAGCDWILEIDAGFSHQPEDIPRFFHKMAEGYACVFGSRFCAGGNMHDSPLSRRVISRGGTVLTNLMLGTRLRDMTSGFELFSRAALQDVLTKGVHSRGPFFQTEIKSHCRDLAIAEVPINYRAPSHNVNSAALKDAFANLWRLFRRRLAN